MEYIELLLDASLLYLIVAWYERDRTMFYCPHLFYLIEKISCEDLYGLILIQELNIILIILSTQVQGLHYCTSRFRLIRVRFII